MSNSSPRYWAVVPAAGSGSRMQSDVPKQYLPLAGRPLLERTLQAMLAWGFLEEIVVALSDGDHRWQDLPVFADPRVRTVTGGAERKDSVLAGLEALDECARTDDWVLVHDAARPCVSAELAQRLCKELDNDTVGGLLALPVAETVKRCDYQQRVVATVDRSDLWLAQTPQMFRYRMLRDALRYAAQSSLEITDEASAIEQAGHLPRLVTGDPANIKITRPGDLALAESHWTLED